MKQYSIKMPHAVYSGENAMNQITIILTANRAKHVAMFTDKGIKGTGLFSLAEEAVKASGASYTVLDDLLRNLVILRFRRLLISLRPVALI